MASSGQEGRVGWKTAEKDEDLHLAQCRTSHCIVPLIGSKGGLPRFVIHQTDHTNTHTHDDEKHGRCTLITV